MIFIVVFVVVFILAVVIGISQSKQIEKIKQHLISSYGLNDAYVSAENGTVVGINFNARKILLGSKTIKAYEFAQIAAVEVVENNVMVTKTNRGSQLIGATLGGIAFGAVGAVVGGMGASARSRQQLRDLSLKVTVDDRLQPVYTICFYRNSHRKGGNREGIIARAAFQQVERFHGHLVNAMHHSRSDSGCTNNSVARESAHSHFVTAAGQIQQLKDYCSSCGALLETGSRFCSSCGAPIKALQPAQPILPPAEFPQAQTNIKEDLFPSILSLYEIEEGRIQTTSKGSRKVQEASSGAPVPHAEGSGNKESTLSEEGALVPLGSGGQIIQIGSKIPGTTSASLPAAAHTAQGISSSSSNRVPLLVALGLFVVLPAVLVVLSRWSPAHSNSQTQNATPHASASAAGQSSASAAATLGPQLARPSAPPPKFQLYRSEPDGTVSIVVAVSTTDEQLKSLLWFFREKVRSHLLKDIGLRPAGVSGLLLVYRGKKCATEEIDITASIGPCGDGYHEAASYQWGIEGDYNKDSGSIQTGGEIVTVFDYKDGWPNP